MRGFLHARWGAVHSFWYGLKLAKAAVISVLLGLLLFYAVPQAQDLFLEVRGSAFANTVFWITFYLAILVGWAIPVYVSSRWVLSRFAQQEATSNSDAGPVAVEDWVRRAIPPLLAALCFGAVLAGQIMSLSNAPTVVEQNELQNRLAQLRTECPDDNIAKCGVIKYASSVAQYFAVLVAGWVGAERILLFLYTICAAAFAWFLLRGLLRLIPGRPWRIAALVLWWTVAVFVMVPATLLALAFLYGLVLYELQEKLNVVHLVVLPLATVLVGWLVWWGLRPGPGERATRVARALMRITGRDAPAGLAAATARLLSPIYFAMLGLTVAVILLLLLVHPVHTTGYVYHALLLPFLFGLLVPAFTYLSYWSTRCRAPLVFTTIVLVAILAARYADTHDVRVIETGVRRDTLEESVQRWAAVNGCELKTVDPARACPQPILVSAAGGASRAAFLVGSVIGKLIDEKTSAVLEGHEEDMQSAAFSPDGRRIVTVSGRTTRLWDPTGANELAAFQGGSPVFGPGGRRVLTQKDDLVARLWDVESGKEIAVLQGEANSVEFSPDGLRVLTGFTDGTARLWDAETGKPIGEPIGESGRGVTYSPDHKRASFSPDGKRIVTASDKTARLWDAQTGSPLGAPLVHEENVGQAMFTPDGRRIVTTSSEDVLNLFFGERVVRLWDADSGKEIAVVKVKDSKIAAISPDRRRVVTETSDRKVQLWDMESGNEIAALPDHKSSLDRAVFSPDGRRLVTYSFDGAWLWDGESGAPIAVLSADRASQTLVAFSLDGRRLATRHSSRIRLWEAETGRRIETTGDVTFLRSLAFSPAGDRMIAGAAEEVRLFDGSTGAEIGAFKGTASQRQRLLAGGRPLRPFGKQLFAISAVSGGALSAVVAYGALADSQTKERAVNGLGNPPCLQTYRDNQWFASHTKAAAAGGPPAADPRDPSAAVWRPHESWRGCLQLILAGDFLSPVFISLISNDLLQLNHRGDRAATLEQAWEMRYAQMTGQDKADEPKQPPSGLEQSTLARPMGFVRQRLLAADPTNWLPVLLLNGTSVTTGKRIVSSDVTTLTESSDRRVLRVFRDAYVMQDLWKVQWDIRLSTGATMSARFPVISPHGNIRDHEAGGRIADRVVDGGYYENFGAVTSLELAQTLRGYGLKPFVIVVNNEPQLSGMDCVTADSSLPLPAPPKTVTFSTLMSPLNALLATGSGHASLAAVQLCSEIGSENFAFITVQPDKHNSKKALSMSWWLSMHVQKYLDDQLDLDGVNRAAFTKIRAVR